MDYHPKGDMCINCKDLYINCSKLKFNEMRVTERDTNVNIVICTNYKKG